VTSAPTGPYAVVPDPLAAPPRRGDDVTLTVAAVIVVLLAATFLGAAGAFLQLAAHPWGLLVALLTAAAFSLGLAWLGYGRPLRLALAGMWLLGAVSPALWRRGGDLVLPDDAQARWFLYGGAALLLLLLVVPARTGGRTTDGPASGR
jgi:hypothetical protein